MPTAPALDASAACQKSKRAWMFTVPMLAIYSCTVLTITLLFIASPDDEMWVARGISPRVLAVLPFLFACLVFVEHPPPGAGIGKLAAPLGTGLKYVPPAKNANPEEIKRLAAPPLGNKGELLKGHAYLIVFFRASGSTLKAAAKADAIARRITAAGARALFHPLLVSRDPFDELQQVSKHWKDRATPIAHDASESASINYITAHKAWTQPHAFVVDEQGVIVWHGQINRKELTQHVASVLSRAKTKVA